VERFRDNMQTRIPGASDWGDKAFMDSSLASITFVKTALSPFLPLLTSSGYPQSFMRGG
jgi:hypothetical protein